MRIQASTLVDLVTKIFESSGANRAHATELAAVTENNAVTQGSHQYTL